MSTKLSEEERQQLAEVDQFWVGHGADEGQAGFAAAAAFGSKAPQRARLVAIGDSWFDFPIHRDTIGWLDHKYGYRIENLGKAGAWVNDMAFPHARQSSRKPTQLERAVKLIEEFRPAGVLISGGGNDLAGLSLSVVVNHRESPKPGLNEAALDAFFDQNVREAWRRLLLTVTAAGKRSGLGTLPIVAHGYDYPWPDGRGVVFNLLGPWLAPSLEQKGFGSMADKRHIMRQVIDRLYAMLASLQEEFPNLHVVNCREVLPGHDDWNDELHPEKPGFGWVADRFHQVLDPLVGGTAGASLMSLGADSAEEPGAAAVDALRSISRDNPSGALALIEAIRLGEHGSVSGLEREIESSLRLGKASGSPGDQAAGLAEEPSLDSLRGEYQSWFDSCEILPEKASTVAWYRNRLLRGRPRYEALAAELNVPWVFLGILHLREANNDFGRHLHNGDSLDARTVRVPAGRPVDGNPPFSFEESARDAIRMKGFDQESDWSVPAMLYRFEKYNGWGYRWNGYSNPYLWCFSQHYTGGGYPVDHHYDPNYWHNMVGAGTMLKHLVDRGIVGDQPAGLSGGGEAAGFVPAPDIATLPVKPAPVDPGALQATPVFGDGQSLRLVIRDVEILKKRAIGKAEVYILAVCVDDLRDEPMVTAAATFEGIRNGDHLPLGPGGFVIYRNPADGRVPRFVDYQILVAESDQGIRDVGQLISDIQADENYQAARKKIVAGLSVANPAAPLVAEATGLIARAFARVLKMNKDDQLFFVKQSFDRDFDALGLAYGLIRQETTYARMAYEMQSAFHSGLSALQETESGGTGGPGRCVRGLVETRPGNVGDSKSSATEAFEKDAALRARATGNPLFQRLRDTLKRVEIDGETLFVAEGDTLLDEDQLAVYAAAREAREKAMAAMDDAAVAAIGMRDITAGNQAGRLVAISQGNRLVRWDDGVKLSYRIARDTFTSDQNYELVRENMRKACSEWEETCGILFDYREDMDTIPGVGREDLIFVVRELDTGGQFIAAAFFPTDPRNRRRVVIDPSYYTTSFDQVGVLRHELGHVLGFRHEHIRSEAPPACPDESLFDTTLLGQYDPKSVMHYFCGDVGSKTLEITSIDREGALKLYGPPLSGFRMIS